MSAIYHKMHQGKDIEIWLDRGMGKWIDKWERTFFKMVTKPDSYIWCLQETLQKPTGTYRVKVQGWKKLYHANGDQKKTGVAILISNKIHFEIKAMEWDKERHYIMIKGSIKEEDIRIINIYAPNIWALQYIKQVLTSVKRKLAVTE